MTPPPFSTFITRRQTTFREDQPMRLMKLLKNVKDKTLWMQILALAIFGGGTAITYRWALTDISGQYIGRDKRAGTVSMAVIRKATSVKAQLGLGVAFLEATEPYAAAGAIVDWTFSTPKRWITKDQPAHTVEFHGKIENGTVTGNLMVGEDTLAINLKRDGLASIYRMLQSHMPWEN